MKSFLTRVRSAINRRRYPKIIGDVRADSLTFLDEAALNDLYCATRQCEKGGRNGVMIEAGCAAGGSSIVITAAKNPERKLSIYDVFGMIPAPSTKDDEDVHKRYEVIKSGSATGIGDRPYYGYQENLELKVEQNFARHGYPIASNNVKLVKGLFQDTMVVDEPVAMAHLDGDWYDSVMVCLQRIVPKLVPGGVIVIDDYFDWSGCRKAVDEYFVDKNAEFEFVYKSRPHIIRRSRRVKTR